MNLTTTSDRSKSRHFTSPSSPIYDSLSNINSTNRNNNNGDYSDDEDDDDEEENGLITNSTSKSKPQVLHKNNTVSTIPSDPTMNLLDETNPHTLQIRLAQMMANMAASSSSPGHHMDTMMSTIANMQRNILLKIFNDPMAAAQATAAAVSATQMKSNISPIALITSNNKQIGSGRKRKSTPEKRVITNHRSTNNNNNGDVKYFLSPKKVSLISFFFRHLQLRNIIQLMISLIIH
jgi:hypothetical protein